MNTYTKTCMNNYLFKYDIFKYSYTCKYISGIHTNISVSSTCSNMNNHIIIIILV